ncbi:sugar transferase, PEP-CTERM/EpsH1 system associated (plasmid) [Paracoccaceae bacterium]|nr:sugar transferase, PEP-CTERM/EpsH1 system associated [Paracoccaceae bacterium]
MRLLVFAHRLELGGTQINAIELAARLRDAHGFDVKVHATEGPALGHLRASGLGWVPASDARFHPSVQRIRGLRALARDWRPDLVHAWDWWQGLEAYAGLYLPMGVPLLISDMMMDLTRAMPREVPTTFGFRGLRDRAGRAGWRRPYLLVPPVDTVANAPGVSDGPAFRRAHGVGGDELLLVSVSRLSEVMKSDPVVRAIRAVGALGGDVPLKLLIVGDGAARERLQALADKANAGLGRRAVVLAGAMADPRPAYAAADVVLGMGGSALRGLAHAKPVIVLGEAGFARIFAPDTADGFEETGMFGRGDGTDAALFAALRMLSARADLRDRLGRFGRRFVVDRHGLDRVTDDLARICAEARQARPPASVCAADAARTAFWYLRERRFRVASRDVRDPATPGPVRADPLRS